MAYDINEMEFPKTIENPLDALVGTILSQNSTDKVTIPLFKKLKNYYSYEQLALMKESELEKLIRPCGLGKSKSKTIIFILNKLKNENNGVITLDFLKTIPKQKAFEYLLSLKGVGPKTAALVLTLGFGHETFPVDTHIYRVLKRVSNISEKYSREKVQEKYEKIIQDSLKRELHLLLILHGRKTCTPRNPKCASCPIYSECAWKFKTKI